LECGSLAAALAMLNKLTTVNENHKA